MKEIPKYRVWNARGVRGGKVKDGPLKEMIYFNLFDLDREYIIGERAYLEGNYKLMQFTGLSDKIGKEIYEGDILKCNTNANWKENAEDRKMYAKVEWNDLDGYWCAFIDHDQHLTSVLAWGNCEIIGNIHENPELLK